MSNPFLALDGAIMPVFDRIVLTLWNWFSLPRIAVIRFAAICWLLGGIMEDIANHAPLIVRLIGPMLILIFQGMEELAARYIPPKTHNSLLLSGRTGGWPPYARVGVLILNICYIFYYASTGFTVGAIDCLSGGLWVMFSWTFIPEEPPKRPSFEFLRNMVPQA